MTIELERISDLESYKILNHEQDENLNDLAKIASLACDVPIAQITFVHDEFTFVKANIGLDTAESIPGKVERMNSFCHHSLNNPEEILIVNDASKDSRFSNNPYVNSNPNIRFYAGKPLRSPDGNPLGTICVVDHKPNELSIREEKILDILSKKVMEYLNTRRKIINQKVKIDTEALKLQNLTSNLPIGIFQLNKSYNDELKFDFLNETMSKMYPSVVVNKWVKSPETLFSSVHPEDMDRFIDYLNRSFDNSSFLKIQYRAGINNNWDWHGMEGRVIKMPDGSKAFYGSIRKINDQIEYEKTLEQIAFDISHILRRPVTNLLSLNDLIDMEGNITKEKLLEYIKLIKTVSTEMETYTRELNDIYQKKKKLIMNHNRH